MVVSQVDEVKDKILSGSESSRAMREIRTRDPTFDMNNFVRSVKVRCFTHPSLHMSAPAGLKALTVPLIPMLHQPVCAELRLRSAPHSAQQALSTLSND